MTPEQMRQAQAEVKALQLVGAIPLPFAADELVLALAVQARRRGSMTALEYAQARVWAAGLTAEETLADFVLAGLNPYSFLGSGTDVEPDMATLLFLDQHDLQEVVPVFEVVAPRTMALLREHAQRAG